MLTPNVNLQNKTVLVTGAAGFIGSNLVLEVPKTVPGIHVVGIDNMRPGTPFAECFLPTLSTLRRSRGFNIL